MARCPCCNSRNYTPPEIKAAIKAATNVREAARKYKLDRRTVQRIRAKEKSCSSE
jgi:hypothetical protein